VARGRALDQPGPVRSAAVLDRRQRGRARRLPAARDVPPRAWTCSSSIWRTTTETHATPSPPVQSSDQVRREAAVSWAPAGTSPPPLPGRQEPPSFVCQAGPWSGSMPSSRRLQAQVRRRWPWSVMALRSVCGAAARADNIDVDFASAHELRNTGIVILSGTPGRAGGSYPGKAVPSAPRTAVLRRAVLRGKPPTLPTPRQSDLDTLIFLGPDRSSHVSRPASARTRLAMGTRQS
jgi:hypothetical protein